MRMRGFEIGLSVLLLGLCGCRGQVAVTEEAVPEDTSTHLSDKIDISLDNWLKLSRPEQAKLVEEWTESVGKQRQSARSEVASVRLLPQLRPPIVVAGFAEAFFSPGVGFSLPPYLKEGQKDAAVALHLAQFGDREAAQKLADPADKDLSAKIDALRSEREYPIEWTRLVSLALQNAELKLANGDADGAAELVQLHRQLRSLLETKAASGVASAPRALATALLPRGRQALALAAVAWRLPRWNKTALAADIDAALADWGETPDPEFAFPRGAGERVGTVIAQSPLAVQRALDLLALPLSSEGADGVAAFCNDKQTLTEVIIVYRPKLSELFPEPRQLALPLVELNYKSEEVVTNPGLVRQSWTGGELSYEVAVLTRGGAGGAWVRVASANQQRPLPGNAAGSPWRDFGAVNLDRSFEQNRLNVAAEKTGASLEIKDAAKLASIAQPARKIALEAAVLQREANENLLSKLTLRWPTEQNTNALGQLALPFLAAFGSARLESQEQSGGGQFTLSWQNETTRLKLLLPFEDKAPELLVEDCRGSAGLPARIAAAAAFDQSERQQRLAVGKPQQRLRRFVQLPAQGIDDLRLGMTRNALLAILPAARSLRVQPLADGLNVLILDEPPAQQTGGKQAPLYWPRQLFVRFGTDDRIAEVRVRYQEGPHAPGSKSPGLLDTLQAKPNGAPESLPSPWAGLWTDLPARKPPVFYRWQDDVTCLTYQRDSGGSEVVLRDRSHAERGNEGVVRAREPLQFCRRGVEGCDLGDSQAEVRKRRSVHKPLLASNGAEVLGMPENSPYDVLLVWYDNDKVSRLIARYRQPRPQKADEVGGALQQAWGADLDRLGFIRRQDGAVGQVLESFGFHDDRTRVRLFAQETEHGIRLFTEWRDWPIAAPSLAAK